MDELQFMRRTIAMEAQVLRAVSLGIALARAERDWDKLAKYEKFLDDVIADMQKLTEGA